MSPEEEFLRNLNLLAKVSDFELDKEVLSIYDQKLSTYGYENVNKALKDIFFNRGARDPFPSIAEIVKSVNCEVTSRCQSDNVASIILTTFRSWKTRYCDNEKFEEWFIEHNGELTWAVVQKMGGYRVLYEEWNYSKNLGMLRAQIRDVATSVIELAKRGQLHTPPALPAAVSNNDQLNQLVGNTIKTIGDGK